MAAFNNTSSAKARKLEHQRQALELRRMGYGYTEIGQKIGLGKSQAHRLVTAALAEARDQVNTGADELRSEEVSRLDAMLAGLWPVARKGGVAAVDRVVKIMERRAKLLGLDAPERKRLEGPNGGPIQAVSLTPDEFRAIAAEIAART